MVAIKVMSLKDFLVEIGVNFVHIFPVDIIVVSCRIRRTDYNGSL